MYAWSLYETYKRPNYSLQEKWNQCISSEDVMGYQFWGKFGRNLSSKPTCWVDKNRILLVSHNVLRSLILISSQISYWKWVDALVIYLADGWTYYLAEVVFPCYNLFWWRIHCLRVDVDAIFSTDLCSSYCCLVEFLTFFFLFGKTLPISLIWWHIKVLVDVMAMEDVELSSPQDMYISNMEVISRFLF